MTSVERVPFGTSIETVKSIIDQDGCVILENFLTKDQVESINAEVEPHFSARRIGPPTNTEATGHSDKAMDLIFGSKSKRITQIVTRSKTFLDKVLCNEQLIDYVDPLMHQSADSYWLSTAHAIEIHPGEKNQLLHRDTDNYPVFRKLGVDGLEAGMNCNIALTDYTDENGGTRLILGSHKWEDNSLRGSSKMTVPLEMKSGSAFLYVGKLIHGGGANRSGDVRRALIMLFVLGWLTPEEAFPFYVPLELVRTLPRRVQQMLGFRSFHNGKNAGGSLWQIEYEELADFLGLGA